MPQQPLFLRQFERRYAVHLREDCWKCLCTGFLCAECQLPRASARYINSLKKPFANLERRRTCKCHTPIARQCWRCRNTERDSPKHREQQFFEREAKAALRRFNQAWKEWENPQPKKNRSTDAPVSWSTNAPGLWRYS